MAKGDLTPVLCLMRDIQVYDVLARALPPRGVATRLAAEAETAWIGLRRRPLHSVLVEPEFIGEVGFQDFADMRRRASRSLRFVFLGGLETQQHPQICRRGVDLILRTPLTVNELVSALKAPRPSTRRWDIQTKGLPA